MLTLLMSACIAGALISLAQGRETTRRSGSAGVTIALPTGWHAMSLATPSGLRVVSDPVTRIVAASAPITFGNGCGQLSYSFRSTAVAVVVLEWTRPTPGVFPPRPRSFTARTLPIHPAPAIECFNGPGGSIEFAVHGRRLDTFILLGRRAEPALTDRARTVLNTLKVVSQKTTPRPSSLPAWASKGTIAYKCGNSVCLAPPDGSRHRELTRGGPWPQWDPAFSADGQMLGFRGYYSPFAEGNYALYISGTNGCDVHKLTGGATHPAWSPDGNWIAFDTAGAGEIWKIRRDGSGLTRIASASRSHGNSSPVWSPDGKRIAFIRYGYGENGRETLWVMRPDGTGKTLLHADAHASDETPAWSHDGKQIAFVERVGQQERVSAMRADGSDVRTLTNQRFGDAWNPVWLPHDSGIAFLQGLNGTGDLYVMRPDGKDVHKIAPLATFQFAWAEAPLPRQSC